MKVSEIHDTLTVTKGPEDGSEYALTTSPVEVGTDPSCVVQIQFDVTVRPVHARLTAAKGGYRVRSAEGAPVHVNGRRAGTMRSRKLRPGGIIKVGHTELLLGCAAEGLATTARETWTDADLAWAIRYAFSRIPIVARFVRGILFRVLKLSMEHWRISLVVLVLALYFSVPAFQDFVNSALNSVREVLEI